MKKNPKARRNTPQSNQNAPGCDFLIKGNKSTYHLKSGLYGCITERTLKKSEDYRKGHYVG